MNNPLAAENGVIGSILLDANCLPAILGVITADDFAMEVNRRIFQAALDLSARDEPIDPVSIRVATKGEIGDSYFLELMNVTLTAANAEIYAQETRKASMRRSLRALSECIDKKVSELEEPRAVIAEAERELARIEAQDTARELACSGDAMTEFFDRRDRIDTGGGGVVPTGFRRLDELLGGGLLCSGLYILAARPAMGKTTFALALAHDIAKRGPVLFVSLEMDLNQIAAKQLARQTGISSAKLLMGQLDGGEYDRVIKGGRELETMPFFYNRRPWATVDDIANMARKTKGLTCVVVDYFGLIRTTDIRASRYEAMTEISGRLKTLARSLKVPVLCLAQLNRENMQRRGNRPQLSDLRDTGALEQDADGVIFLHRPDYYETQDARDPCEPALLQIILEKNRHGATGLCDAAFYMATGRIVPAYQR